MAKQRSGRGGLVRAGDIQLPLLEQLGAAPAPEKDRKAITPEIVVEGELIRPEDVAYVHSIFLQCFIPVRHHEKNHQLWQTDCGNASLVIRAGLLAKPDSLNTFKQCMVPAGPKARIITAYINDFAYREKTPEIDLGRNLHQAMRRMNISIGGRNRKELTREVENVAAAEILMGLWLPDGSAHQKSVKVADDVSFWVDKNPDQKTIWQPTMTLSQRYYASIQETQHMAPVYWPALVGLQHNARAMDIHTFLAYRLRKPLKQPVLLHAKVLHRQFGRDIKELRHFWPHFTKALKEAIKYYPTARVEILNDAIKLFNSPPLIPHRKLGHIE